MTSRPKIRVAILFGGKSAEHEVSLRSARNVVQALDTDRFEASLVGIDKAGAWHFADPAALLSGPEPRLVPLEGSPTPSLPLGLQTDSAIPGSLRGFDAAFPVLHGPFGEDGSIQGLLKVAGIPCVGPGVLGSAVGMDKDAMKRLFRDAGLPVGPFRTFHDADRDGIRFDDVATDLGLPFYVKPANLGSSVGISRVKDESGFRTALDLAFSFDRKIVVESDLSGREVECAVIGNGSPEASRVGEIVSNARSHEFYSYEAKYLDDNGAALVVPAALEAGVEDRIRDLAIRAFRSLCCEGMARVDFFLQSNGEIFVNEINTIPGFTSTSMYPKLWEASGRTYTRLISDLIDFAIARHRAESNLRTSIAD